MRSSVGLQDTIQRDDKVDRRRLSPLFLSFLIPNLSSAIRNISSNVPQSVYIRPVRKGGSQFSSRRGHTDFRDPSSGSLADYDFYVPAKRVEKIYQAFHGKSIQAVIRQSGYLRLIYFQYL